MKKTIISRFIWVPAYDRP